MGLRINAMLTPRDRCTLKIPHLLYSKAQETVYMHNIHLRRRITSNRKIQLEREFHPAPIPSNHRFIMSAASLGSGSDQNFLISPLHSLIFLVLIGIAHPKLASETPATSVSNVYIILY